MDSSTFMNGISIIKEESKPEFKSPFRQSQELLGLANSTNSIKKFYMQDSIESDYGASRQ